MSYDADLAIIYACALALLGSLLVWVVPATVMALAASIRDAIEKRRNQQSPGQPRPKRPFRALPPRIPGIHGAR